LANKPKIQGTRFESATRDLLKSWGFKAYRLAEGGLKDEGDVQVELPDEVIFECKARQNLNIHQTYHKATQKTDKPVILAWKKLVNKGSGVRRSPDGATTLYIIDEQLLEQIKKELIRKQNSKVRVSGRAAQDRAKRLLGIPDKKLGKDSEEEFWDTKNIRLEVKSGKQANGTMTLFEKAESQSWDYELTKDEQRELFGLIAMPEGTKDGLFICRLSLIKEVVLELENIWKEVDNGMDKK